MPSKVIAQTPFGKVESVVSVTVLVVPASTSTWKGAPYTAWSGPVRYTPAFSPGWNSLAIQAKRVPALAQLLGATMMLAVDAGTLEHGPCGVAVACGGGGGCGTAVAGMGVAVGCPGAGGRTAVGRVCGVCLERRRKVPSCDSNTSLGVPANSSCPRTPRARSTVPCTACRQGRSSR